MTEPVPGDVADTVKQLRELSAWLTEHDQDMRMPRGMIDPDKAADALARVARERDAWKADAVNHQRYADLTHAHAEKAEAQLALANGRVEEAMKAIEPFGNSYGLKSKWFSDVTPETDVAWGTQVKHWTAARDVTLIWRGRT